MFPSVRKITGMNNNQDIQRSKIFKVWFFCLLEHSLTMPCTSPEYYLIINFFWNTFSYHLLFFPWKNIACPLAVLFFRLICSQPTFFVFFYNVMVQCLIKVCVCQVTFIFKLNLSKEECQDISIFNFFQGSQTIGSFWILFSFSEFIFNLLILFQLKTLILFSKNWTGYLSVVSQMKSRNPCIHSFP